MTDFRTQAREQIADSLFDCGRWPEKGLAKLDFASYVNDLMEKEPLAADAFLNALWCDSESLDGVRNEQRKAITAWIPRKLVEKLAEELEREEITEREYGYQDTEEAL